MCSNTQYVKHLEKVDECLETILFHSRCSKASCETSCKHTMSCYNMLILVGKYETLQVRIQRQE